MNGPSEKAVVARLFHIYKSVGCSIYSTQQTRASRQAVGLPDLYVVHPRAGGWWHEAKRPGGKQSPGQRAFQLTVEAAGVGYVLGGADEAFAYLTKRGLLNGLVLGSPSYLPAELVGPGPGVGPRPRPYEDGVR